MPRRLFAARIVLVLAGLSALPAVSLAQAKKAPQEELTDLEMEALAKKEAAQGKFVAIETVQSKNEHLGNSWILKSPVANTRFWCVVQAYTPAAPVRSFLAVQRNGKVTYPFKTSDFAAVLVGEDRSRWSDEQYLQAASLRIHLTAPSQQDGWKVLATPEEFMAIKFNMPPQNEAKRANAAKAIEKPKVTREKNKVQVRLWAWHLIGGNLRQWTVEFSELDVKAEATDHGSFGGGGYE